jgi:type I restriction enzyme M protein
MLTSPKLKSQVDALWDKLWSGGLSNPMDAIEQFSYLLFFKRLDDAENLRERQASRRGEGYQVQIESELRWGYWTKLPAADALSHVKEQVFPSFKKMGQKGDSFERYMQNAEFKINKSTLLIEACNAIDEMQISAQNQDAQGDLYEYLLSKLNTAGRAGQFRTPRHIIRMMVAMSDPQPHERIADLAAGTCGFLVNAYQHILAAHTTPEILEWDADGSPRNLVGDQLNEKQRAFLQSDALRGYDNDSGMTMLRIGSMNLMLHGIRSPQYFYMDTLSKEFDEPRAYDLILMNPPFKGKVDKANLNENLPSSTTKSELLFVHLILDALEMGGRAAVIVPDGVLFGSSRAHVELRKKLIEENRLDGVVSMPSGVFKPYAGVSTAVLFFTRGASTERIWFYDMAQDGFSLDDKRQPVDANDIPDIQDCWKQRNDAQFAENREKRIGALRAELEPLKKERLQLDAELNRLTFDLALASAMDDSAASELDAVKAQRATLDARIATPQAELDQLTRQFWVDAEAVRQKKYDLSASRYRQTDPDESYHESPQVTLERLARLEQVMADEIEALKGML